MTDQEYLEKVLDLQTLKDDSKELKDLEKHHRDVEKLLKKEFGDKPVLREGGSKAKGTMIREDYDLDLPYYFARDDESAGKTIKEIFESVEKALKKEYRTTRKGVAVRLLDAKEGGDFYIDVVSGRFIDGNDGDAFLYPSSTDKERLQTHLQKHVAHVRDSGVVKTIRLLKLWRVRRKIEVKTFALELLTIDLLEKKTSATLADQLKHVWTEMCDNLDDRTITDPANKGNDLSELLNTTMKKALKENAKETLEILEDEGWEGVFGKLPDSDDGGNEKAAKAAALKRIALSTASPSKPWRCEG